MKAGGTGTGPRPVPTGWSGEWRERQSERERERKSQHEEKRKRAREYKLFMSGKTWLMWDISFPVSVHTHMPEAFWTSSWPSMDKQGLFQRKSKAQLHTEMCIHTHTHLSCWPKVLRFVFWLFSETVSGNKIGTELIFPSELENIFHRGFTVRMDGTDLPSHWPGLI